MPAFFMNKEWEAKYADIKAKQESMHKKFQELHERHKKSSHQFDLDMYDILAHEEQIEKELKELEKHAEPRRPNH